MNDDFDNIDFEYLSDEDNIFESMDYFISNALECLEEKDNNLEFSFSILDELIENLREEARYYKKINIDDLPDDFARFYVKTLIEIDDSIPYFYKSEKIEKLVGAFLSFRSKLEEYIKLNE